MIDAQCSYVLPRIKAKIDDNGNYIRSLLDYSMLPTRELVFRFKSVVLLPDKTGSFWISGT